MPEKVIDFGTFLDVNFTGRLKDDRIGPGDRADFYMEIKAMTAPHAAPGVSIAMFRFPPPEVNIEPPGPAFAFRAPVPLPVAGQQETVHFMVESLGASDPATYFLIIAGFVDGAFAGAWAFPAP